MILKLLQSLSCMWSLLLLYMYSICAALMSMPPQHYWMPMARYWTAAASRRDICDCVVARPTGYELSNASCGLNAAPAASCSSSAYGCCSRRWPIGSLQPLGLPPLQYAGSLTCCLSSTILLGHLGCLSIDCLLANRYLSASRAASASAPRAKSAAS